MENPRHLGDGAYATITQDGFILITANHHDPAMATDKIYLTTYAISNLKNIIKELEQGGHR